MAKPSGRTADGVWEDTLAGLQGADSSDGVNAGDKGRIVDAADTRNGLDVICISEGGGTSVWGYKRAFSLSAKQSTSSGSNGERFSCWFAQNTLGASLGQVGYGAYDVKGYLWVLGGRFENESDLGSCDFAIYKNGNATAVASDTINPGAATHADLDLEASFDPDDYMEFGLDPTNARTALERQMIVLDCLELVVLT